MNRFALLSLYRSLTRHRLYAALNIGGLAVGIAVFLVLGLYVRFETSFEKWLPHHDEIYLVQTVWNLPESPVNGAYPYTMGGLLEQMREDFPGILGARIRGGKGAGTVRRGNSVSTEDVAQVDTSFFDVFDLPMVMGNGAQALKNPTATVISESFARKYFGTGDPIGQTVTIAFDTPVNYRVAAVFRDLPKNSDLNLSAVVPLPRTSTEPNWFHWGSSSLQTYLRFATPTAAKQFAQKLRPFVGRRGLADLGPNPWDTERLALLPISKEHLEPEGSASASRKMTIVTLGLVGSLTLMIAIVNYINLATARAGLRAREVAIRKTLGADRWTLIRQFLGEALLTVTLAALIGLVLAELMLPLINAAGGLSLSIPYTLVVPALLLLVVAIGIVAGFYPALLLSGFPAAQVLASARAPGGGRAGSRIREALVIVQFGMAIALMIGTTVLVAQTQHVRADRSRLSPRWPDRRPLACRQADRCAAAACRRRGVARAARRNRCHARQHCGRGHRRDEQRQRATTRNCGTGTIVELGRGRSALLRYLWRAPCGWPSVRCGPPRRRHPVDQSGGRHKHHRQSSRIAESELRHASECDRQDDRRRSPTHGRRRDRRPAVLVAA